MLAHIILQNVQSSVLDEDPEYQCNLYEKISKLNLQLNEPYYQISKL